MATGSSLLRTVCQLNKLFFPTTARRCAPILSSTTTTTTPITRTLFSKSKGTTEKTTAETPTDKSEEKSDEVNEKLAAIVAEKDEEIEKHKVEAADFKDKYIRALAESENIRRRGDKLTADAKLYAIQKMSKDLLDVADILERASESVPEAEREGNETIKQLFNGVIMTEIELQKVFKKHGLEKVDPLDQPFDPNFHEAMFQMPVEGKTSGTVAVVQKVGYKLHGRALRAAQVGVVL